MDYQQKMQDYAPALLRWGISLVFLWFGVSQLMNPNNFIGYLPSFLFSSSFAKTFVLVNGAFEILFGLLLLLGFFIRFVAFILGLHLLGIILSIGYGEVAVRDFGLMIASFAIVLRGDDIWSLQAFLKKT